jgi:hypothetical protein
MLQAVPSRYNRSRVLRTVLPVLAAVVVFSFLFANFLRGVPTTAPASNTAAGVVVPLNIPMDHSGN